MKTATDANIDGLTKWMTAPWNKYSWFNATAVAGWAGNVQNNSLNIQRIIMKFTWF